jgi:carboxymethylenebutenolidase
MQSRPAIVSLILAFALSVAPAFAQAPPSADEAQAAIDRSPRHGEWVSIDRPPVQIKSWMMYPERSNRAPVVIVIHPGGRLNDWTRAVADRLAADGYLAIAPDLDVAPNYRVLALDAVHAYVLKIPAANGKVATLGFEQGGYTSFQYALARPALNAAIVFSGTFPPHIDDSDVGRAPVLALYGGKPPGADYAIAQASKALGRLKVSFEHEVYEGASYDFVYARDTTGLNEAAARMAWARVLAFLGRHLQ